MKDKTHIIMFGLLIVVLLAVIFSNFRTSSQVITIADKNPTISVSANAEKEVMPDEVVLRFSVITEGLESEKVQQQNTLKMNNVMETLKKFDAIIETIDYYLYPKKRYDPDLRKSVDDGYELRQTVKITTKKIEETGKIITAATQSGANSVQGISFQLSDELEEEIKEELLAKATTDAKLKAEVMAKNAKVSLGKLASLNENSAGYYPRYDVMTESAVMKAGATPEPQIEPKKVSVSLGVSASFYIN